MERSIQTIVTETYGKARYVHIRTKDAQEVNGTVYDWDENVVALMDAVNLCGDKYERISIKWNDIEEAYVPFPRENIMYFAEVSIWEHVSAYVTLNNGKKHHVIVFDYDDVYVTMFDVDNEAVVDVRWHEIVDISKE